MKKILAHCLCLLLTLSVAAQTPPARQQQPPAQPPPVGDDEEILRVTTALVQVDAVVVDKNDRPVPDLKLSDFEIYENGKRQNLQFIEFVDAGSGERRVEGDRELAKAAPAGVELTPSRELSAKEVKRTFAFVVDDLTIPVEDMVTVRQLLRDFVDNQMHEGDLVSIVRTMGGQGLLEQFTSDKQMLRRAISQLSVSTSPFSAFNNPAIARMSSPPQQATAAPDSGDVTGGAGSDTNLDAFGLQNFSDPNNETVRLLRGLTTLSSANFVVESMKNIPGRKSMVLITGGIPIFEVAGSSTSDAYSTVTYMLNQLADNAVRSGVAISTMDPRGLKATPGVTKFSETPARSALGDPDPNFGRGGSSAGRADIVSSGLNPNSGADDPFGSLLAGGAEHLGLGTVASATGGVSVINTNNFREGLDKVLAHSASYYILAYTPTEKFDNKFRRVQIKVKRDGLRVYTHQGYLARADRPAAAMPTKEEAIMAAAKSPLARRDLDVTATVMLKPSPANRRSAVDVHLLIDPHRLNFTQDASGHYQTSFDVVGFVYDQLGKMRGGFSETVKTDLTPESYQKAVASGLTYTASTELPPGYYQIRGAVREAGTGNLGTISKYIEVPDLGNGRLTMSSLYLFAADPGQGTKGTPVPLLASRQLTRKQDLRYAAVIYNAKAQGGKAQVRTELIISQAGKILYREPEQEVAGATGEGPVTKIGQIGLSGVAPGRYVLSLIVTDPLADKKAQKVARAIDFTVTN